MPCGPGLGERNTHGGTLMCHALPAWMRRYVTPYCRLPAPLAVVHHPRPAPSHTPFQIVPPKPLQRNRHHAGRAACSFDWDEAPLRVRPPSLMVFPLKSSTFIRESGGPTSGCLNTSTRRESLLFAKTKRLRQCATPDLKAPRFSPCCWTSTRLPERRVAPPVAARCIRPTTPVNPEAVRSHGARRLRRVAASAVRSVGDA